MSLFYTQEHKTCYNYKLPTSATFKLLQFDKVNAMQTFEVDRSVIIFLLEGKASVTCNNYKDKIHQAGEMVLFPRNCSCYANILEKATIISCSFVQNIDLCNRFSFAHLINFVPEGFTYDFVILPMAERIKQFAALLKNCLEDGLSCVHFHELMEQELFILLRAYYNKEDLASFFYPLLGKDLDFKDFVLSNYMTVDSLPEFAELANLSVDTFKRRFKETFGEPAHRWIVQRKSELIFRDLIASEKSFADIAFEYKLSSQAYLSTFCKRHFGKTPQEIRDSSK